MHSYCIAKVPGGLTECLCCYRSQEQSLRTNDRRAALLPATPRRQAKCQWSAGSSPALWCWVTVVSSSQFCAKELTWLRLILRWLLAAARARTGRCAIVLGVSTLVSLCVDTTDSKTECMAGALTYNAVLSASAYNFYTMRVMNKHAYRPPRLPYSEKDSLYM